MANPMQSYRFYSSICYSSSLLFMVGLVLVRCGRKMLHDNKEWFSEDNNLFMITAVVAVFVAESTALVLVYENHRGWRMMRDVHYVYIKSIGCISAVVAAFSIMMVVFLPPKFNWIGVTGGFIISGLMLAVCCWYERNCKSDETVNHTYAAGVVVLIYVPLSLVLVLLVPMDQNWIVDSTMVSFVTIHTAALYKT